MKYSEYDVRMKENYEKRAASYLVKRIPVIIRIDGKCFSGFCRRFEKPYDHFLNNSLNKVMQFLCQNIQGAKLAERHSDEISILLTDFDTIRTDAYLNYNVQKISSIVASMATAEFCRLLTIRQIEFEKSTFIKPILSTVESWPCFDARCFNIPMHEVANYFWWRMLDAKRNSINMVAQSYFSHKQLQGKSSNDMQEMIWQEKQINWSKLPQGQKIGFLCMKNVVQKEIPCGPMKGEVVDRNEWGVLASPSKKSELDDLFSNIKFEK